MCIRDSPHVPRLNLTTATAAPSGHCEAHAHKAQLHACADHQACVDSSGASVSSPADVGMRPLNDVTFEEYQEGPVEEASTPSLRSSHSKLPPRSEHGPTPQADTHACASHPEHGGAVASLSSFRVVPDGSAELQPGDSPGSLMLSQPLLSHQVVPATPSDASNSGRSSADVAAAEGLL